MQCAMSIILPKPLLLPSKYFAPNEIHTYSWPRVIRSAKTKKLITGAAFLDTVRANLKPLSTAEIGYCDSLFYNGQEIYSSIR